MSSCGSLHEFSRKPVDRTIDHSMSDHSTSVSNSAQSSGSEPSDVIEAELVAQLQAGYESAFEVLLRSHGGRMLAVARRMLGNDEDAQDAVQEAFLSAWKSIGQFEQQSKLGTWLHRIVVNVALMKLRSRRRKPEGLIDDLLPKFLDDGHQVQPAVDWRDTADVTLQKSESRAMVRHCIQQLPELYRTVLILRDLEELDTDETARMLGVTTAVVKTRLHRARLALRTLLDPHFRGDSA